MKEISHQEIKTIQLDILSALDTFCRENDITYSIACGTMLGAVRHRGYIPWDDDIDIYMLREDFCRFVDIFPLSYNDYYSVLSLERDDKWDFAYAKAFDNRTILVESANYNVKYGVNIDIYPIDEVPEDNCLWEAYDKKRRKIQYLNSQVKSYPIFSLEPKKFLIWIYTILLHFFYPTRRLAEKIDEYSKKWYGTNSAYVFECCQGILQKKRFKKSTFDNIVSYLFEDRQFLGFKNYDEYLKNAYGDYMQLPPMEKRVTHHNFKAYWIK